MEGGLIQFLIVLVIVGAILFLLDRLTVIDGTVKLFIKVIIIVVMVIWAIRLLLPMAGLG